MPDGLVGILGVATILLVVGGVIGVTQRQTVSFRWLLVAAGLVVLNDLLLTRAWGHFPEFFPSSDWNWQGKTLALLATLALAALPAFGWKASGLNLRQAPGSLKVALPAVLAYVAFFTVLALVFSNEPASAETIAFQLTMPGFEEEPFYRGLLLLVLCRAFTAEKASSGVGWSWGAILSCALFGMAHAFGYSDGGFHFDGMTMALTALPSLIGVWLALRTRSVLLPVLIHNFGNAIMLLL